MVSLLLQEPIRTDIRYELDLEGTRAVVLNFRISKYLVADSRVPNIRCLESSAIVTCQAFLSVLISRYCSLSQVKNCQHLFSIGNKNSSLQFVAQVDCISLLVQFHFVLMT